MAHASKTSREAALQTVPNRKRVALSDVAREAGVAVSTASAILRHEKTCRATQATRDRVFDTAKQVGYRRNRLAWGLAGKRSNLIGVIFDSLTVPVVRLAQLSRFEELASAEGYRVIVGHQQGDPQREHEYVNEFLDYQVAGLVLCPNLRGHTSMLREVAESGVPAITVNDGSSDILPDVSVDRVHGGYLLVQHLLQDAKCKRLAFLVPDVKVGRGLGKIAGFEKALAEHGSSMAEHIVVTYDCSLPRDLRHDEYSGGAATARALLARDQWFDGVVTMSDATAAAAMRILMEAGVRIPADAAIVGYDDQPFAKHLRPSLTTVQQPLALGERAFAFLLDQFHDRAPHQEKQVLMEPELVVRESSVPAAVS